MADPRRAGEPTVRDALPLARTLFARHSGGCCLHTVLEDRNVEDRCVASALDRANELGHVDCATLAVMLRGMSGSQRGRVARRLR